MASAHMAASTPPAAPSMWPVMLFVEETSRPSLAWLPKTFLMALTLRDVAHRRGGAVRVHVLHVARADAGVLEAQAHGALGAEARTEW